jgi:hypothetical protein
MMRLGRRGLQALGLVVLITACGSLADDEEEITRVASPDRLVDAVLVQVGGGATVGFSYNVHVVPSGQSWQRGHQVLTADRYENLQLAWRDVRQLELCFDSARVFHFTNFWHSRDVQNFGYVVNIRLIEPATACAPAASKVADTTDRRGKK